MVDAIPFAWACEGVEELKKLFSIGIIFLLVTSSFLSFLPQITQDSSNEESSKTQIVKLSAEAITLFFDESHGEDIVWGTRKDNPIIKALLKTLRDEGYEVRSLTSSFTHIIWQTKGTIDAREEIGYDVYIPTEVDYLLVKVNWSDTKYFAAVYLSPPGGTHEIVGKGKFEVHAHKAKPGYWRINLYSDTPQSYSVIVGEGISPLQYNVLKTANALVMLLGTYALSEEEITNVERFVREGGGLFIVAEYGGSPLNQLSKKFGIEINSDIVCDPTNNYEGDIYWPIINKLDKTHPILNGIESITLYAGSSLTLSGSAVPLAYGDEDTFADTNRNRKLDPGETYGKDVVVLAYNIVGRGKVVVFTDANYLMDIQPDLSMRSPLFLNVIKWITLKLDVEKIAKVYIKSVILNRVSATTQTGLFIAIDPRKISEIVGKPVAWMPGLGVWASITVENKDTKSFDGYLKVFLKSPSGRTYETAKGIVHIDPEKEETYFAPIYYYDIFSGVRGTETGMWHVYVELFEGIFIPLSKKIDDAGPIDLMVAKDEVIIAPDPYFWSAGDVIPIDDFIKADKPSIIEKYYEPLNLFFLIMQALAKVKSPETLDTILPSPTRVSDPSIISGALAGSTDFDVKIKDLGRNIYNIIVTYTVKPYDITVFGKNYHFVNWYDRVHVELTFPSIFEVIDAGDAYSHVTYEDGKTYVAWFDIYCDKLLYPTPDALQRTKSHSIKVSIKDPISASAIVEGYAYFEVGPFDSTSLKSFPIINYQKWKENPSEIAWILFVTKRDQEIISLVPTETGNLATLKPLHISTNSTVIKVTSDRENQKIVIKLEGPSATRGFMNITIAKDLALLGSKQPVIKVYFDGNPQSYKLVELDGSLLISLEYTHPIYTLELYYGSKAPQEIADFKTLGILITVAILLSTATTYFLYRRRRHRIVKISS